MEKSAYDRLSAPFTGHPRRIAALKAANTVATGLMYVLYITILIILMVYEKYDSLTLLEAVLVPASGFFALTVFRSTMNVPRRYEVWPDRPSLLGKTSPGKSFPSRHLYSAAVIAMTALWLWPVIGAAALVVTAVMAAIRVIGGVHYVRDVAVGGFAGVVWGLAYWWLPLLT